MLADDTMEGCSYRVFASMVELMFPQKMQDQLSAWAADILSKFTCILVLVKDFCFVNQEEMLELNKVSS